MQKSIVNDNSVKRGPKPVLRTVRSQPKGKAKQNETAKERERN